MLVRDANDLVNIHTADTANLCKLIGKSDVHGAERILNNLRHLGRTNIGNRDLSLTEACVKRSNTLSHLDIIGTDGPVVMHQLVNHAARNNTLGGMYERDVLTPRLFKQRPHKAIDCIRRNRRLDDKRRTLGSNINHRLARYNHIGRIDLLVQLVIRSRHTHDVRITGLILGSKGNAGIQRCGKQLVEAFLLKRGLSCIECCN